MNLAKNLNWALLFTFIFPNLLNAQEKLVIYGDSIYDHGDYMLKFTHSYSKLLFFKTTVQVTNTTEKFLIFPADNIFVKTDKTEKCRVHLERYLVAAPQHTAKYSLRFNGLNLSENKVYFHMNKALVADEKIGRYEAFTIRAIPDAMISVGNIRLTILNAHHGKNYYKVKIKIENIRKENFLAINYTNVYIKTIEGDVVYHKAKKNQRFHYEGGERADIVYLVFHISHEFKTDNNIYFDNVFSEYSLKEIPEYTFETAFNSVKGKTDSKAIEKKEKEEEKQEKKEDH